MDQGRQDGHPLDPALLPPVSGQRGAVTLGGDRLQPWQSAATARPAPLHPELVPHESPATAVQDGRTPHPACSVLHPATCRKLLDGQPFLADSRAHRAVRLALDVSNWTTQAEKRSDAGASVAREGGQPSEDAGSAVLAPRL